MVSSTLKSVTQAVGFTGDDDPPGPCSLQVGDVVSHANAPGLFFVVTSRWLVIGNATRPSRWYLRVQQTTDPTADTAPSP
jgi:hypothetical protein